MPCWLVVRWPAWGRQDAPPLPRAGQALRGNDQSGQTAVWRWAVPEGRWPPATPLPASTFWRRPGGHRSAVAAEPHQRHDDGPASWSAPLPTSSMATRWSAASALAGKLSVGVGKQDAECRAALVPPAQREAGADRRIGGDGDWPRQTEIEPPARWSAGHRPARTGPARRWLTERTSAPPKRRPPVLPTMDRTATPGRRETPDRSAAFRPAGDSPGFSAWRTP